jgi:hypothetical protein
MRQYEEYDKGYRAFSRISAEFIDKLVSHYVLDDGNLVVAHAGMKAEMQGRGSGKVREFALYGETTGKRTNMVCRPVSLGSRVSRQGYGGLRPYIRLRNQNG